MKFVRINSNFTPQYTVDKLVLVEGSRHEQHLPNGILYYELMKCSKYPELTFVSKGLITPEQWWSSNSDAIRKHFNIDCIECSVKELKGDYPDSLFATCILSECVKLPDTLEWGTDWGMKAIMPKPGIVFPRRKDYFMSTHLDENGQLIEQLTRV